MSCSCAGSPHFSAAADSATHNPETPTAGVHRIMVQRVEDVVFANGGQGRELHVGDKVEVLWPQDDKFYPGIVVDINGDKCEILYDDNDVEHLKMVNETWRFQTHGPSIQREQGDINQDAHAPQGAHLGQVSQSNQVHQNDREDVEVVLLGAAAGGASFARMSAILGDQLGDEGEKAKRLEMTGGGSNQDHDNKSNGRFHRGDEEDDANNRASNNGKSQVAVPQILGESADAVDEDEVVFVAATPAKKDERSYLSPSNHPDKGSNKRVMLLQTTPVKKAKMDETNSNDGVPLGNTKGNIDTTPQSKQSRNMDDNSRSRNSFQGRLDKIIQDHKEQNDFIMGRIHQALDRIEETLLG